MMSFPSRTDVYRWSEKTGFQGRQEVLIVSGGFAHRFLLECAGRSVKLFYRGLAA